MNNLTRRYQLNRVMITVGIEVRDWDNNTKIEYHEISYVMTEDDNIDDRFEELCDRITAQYAQ